MKLKVVSVYDSAVQAFMRPIFVAAVGAAVRSFTDEMNRPESEMHRHPQDYVLYELGEFDDSDGSMVSITPPKMLVRGSDVITQGASRV